jgi:hypothetical protein
VDARAAGIHDTAITMFLAEEWEIWMQWPNAVVEKCQIANRDANIGHEDYADCIGTEGDSRLGILSEVQLHYSRIRVDE